MLTDYAGDFTGEQTCVSHLAASTNAGSDNLFTEAAGGAKAGRCVVQELGRDLRVGDSLVVRRLDRLGRSLKQQSEASARRSEPAV